MIEKTFKNLLEFPSLPILFGKTPITDLNAPLRIAQSNMRDLKVNTKFPIFLKRDDLTPGFGNKTRKLEPLLADAIKKGANAIITAGGPQSNHCRQTAQFGRQMGIEIHLMFGTNSGMQDFEYSGNQIIDRLFNAQIHVCKKGERAEAMEALFVNLSNQGKRPYIIPVGGSNYLGAIAYAKGFFELLEQCRDSHLEFKRIVFASSSGGTQAGLVVGAKLAEWKGDILGISIDQVPDKEESNIKLKYVEHMIQIANQALEALNASIRVSSSDFKINYDYLQNGYGVVGEFDKIGVNTLANHGIIAGPVYSGRAFGAFIDLISKGIIPDDGKTIFWHTGGAGELDVYKNDLFNI